MKTKVRGKILAILMSLAMAFTMIPMIGGTAYADSEVTVDGIIYSLHDDNTASVIGNSGALSDDIVLPETVNGYLVTAIESYAFPYNGIKSVTIPASVSTIGGFAFYECEFLETVTLAEGSKLSSIEGCAFEATAITSINIPVGVTSIGDSAFKDCNSLETVVIAEESKLSSIGDSAFEATAITSVNIPADVTSIGNAAFNGCGSLKNVTFEEESKLTSIGFGAFEGTAFTKITIPAGVTSIGLGAFSYCKSLETVTFEEWSKLSSIEGCVFQSSAITSITIPAGVKSIGDAFADCESLETVTFEEGSLLESIGERAFEGSAITSITIPAGVTSIDSKAFRYCDSLETVTFEEGSLLESIKEMAFDRSGITSIIIPASVTEIGERALDTGHQETVAYYFGTRNQWLGMSNRHEDWAGGTDVTVVCENEIVVEEPIGKTLPYNGNEQIGVDAGEGYTLTGTSSATDIGTYSATATLGFWYVWADGTTEPKNITWKICYEVDEPTGKTLTYNGKAQTGVTAGEGYTLSGTTSATNAGSYQATATLAEDYVWSDGTSAPKTITWKINKASVKVTAPAGKTFTYNGKAQTGVASGANYTLSGTVKATKAGTFTAKATLKTNANYVYKWADGTTAVKSIKWKINKAANPLTIKAKTATVKGSTKGKNGKLKKTKTLAVSKVIAFTKKGQGKMTYTKSSGSKKITIAKTTGKVTVKKGLKKGTYKVKVKVKAAGNANYKVSAVKTVTFKVVVK